jgi:hypothetical protein
LPGLFVDSCSGAINMKTKITYDRLFELMDYDPNSGVFSWKISRGKEKAMRRDALIVLGIC